jgi:hypothetical protein
MDPFGWGEAPDRRLVSREASRRHLTKHLITPSTCRAAGLQRFRKEPWQISNDLARASPCDHHFGAESSRTR